MAFTMAELRHELQALGYGALPDEFIVSSLAQLQLGVPQSWDRVESGEKGGGSSSSRASGKSVRVHGSPVPGDREYVSSTRATIRGKKELGSFSVRKGGLDSVCFTPDFATELDEMRKMLKVMQGTKEQLFRPTSVPSSSTHRAASEGIGLADEHERYIGNLLDQWRVVGKTIRSRRKECAKVDVGSNSVTKRHRLIDQHPTTFVNSEDRRRNRKEQHDAFLQSDIHPPAEQPLEQRWDDGCDLQAEKNAQPEPEEINEVNRSAEAECPMGKVRTDHHHQQEGKGGIFEPNFNEEASTELQVGTGVSGNDSTGPIFTRQESFSAISPGASYQQGGMLYPENFALDPPIKPSDPVTTTQEIRPRCAQDGAQAGDQDGAQAGDLDGAQAGDQDGAQVQDNPASTSPHSSTAQTPKAVLDSLAALSQDQFLAAFHKSLDDLDPQDVIDQETFANVNQKISDSTVKPNSTPLSRTHHQPVAESENPLDSGFSQDLMRTPDRRGGGGHGHRQGHGNGAHQSPLNDRSNMRMAEEEDADGVSRSRSKLKQKTESNSPAAAAPKRNTTVTLKRSRSSRGPSRRDEIGEEANGTHLSNFVEGGGAQPLSENTTPPPSARKFKSERVLRHSLSEKSISPRVTIRNRGVVDQSDLAIPSLGLSPIRIREQPASPLNHHSVSSRERSCVANGYSEHRLGSHCSACHPPPATLRKSGEIHNSQSTTTGIRSPFGKSNSEAATGIKSPFGKSNSEAATGIRSPFGKSNSEAATGFKSPFGKSRSEAATGFKSPFGKSNSEAGLSETEVSPSPQQKRSGVRREVAEWSLSKRKLPLKKSSPSAPSGIYTALVEPKKDDINNSATVVLKTRRLASSMEFSSDSARLTDRRVPSLRSSAESTRSSGAQRATTSQSQVSKNNPESSPYAKSSSFGSRSSTPKETLSSPYAKSSSFASFGSRSASSKDPLTPGGPRRGGKVDRVARFAEMQSLWKNDKFLKTSTKRKPQSFHRIFARLHLSHERCTASYRERVLEEMRPSTEQQPPFVVPTTLYNNAEGVCIF